MNTGVRFAIADNVAWCTLISSELNNSPSVPRFGGVLFRRKVPAYFPNYISTDCDVAARNQCGLADELRSLGLPAGFGIKDSYANLDLSDQGFRCAIEGQWIVSGGEQRSDTRIPPDVSILWPKERHGIEAWIQSSGITAIDVDRFLGSPRAVRSVALVALLKAERIQAGAIINASERVLGISNVFSLDPELDMWPLLKAAIRRRVGHALLVGWEAGEALEAACAAGFEAVHPMRVWIDGRGQT